jgi:hypothetical protein
MRREMMRGKERRVRKEAEMLMRHVATNVLHANLGRSAPGF